MASTPLRTEPTSTAATTSIATVAAAEPAQEEPVAKSPPATNGATTAAVAADDAAAPQAPTSTSSPALKEPVVAAAPEPPATAPKSEVTLRLRGGGFQVTGELRGFDGTRYVIATRTSGVMTMDATRFECQGEACARPAAAIQPLTERPNPLKPDRITIESAATFGAEFMPQLIKAYAVSIAATAVELPRTSDKSEGAPAGPAKYRINDSRGAELATIEVATAGTLAALGALEQGSAILAFTEHAGASEDEQRSPPAGTKRAVAVSEQLIGYDGVAVVASPKVALASLSIETLAKLFSGQITDWFELGAEPAPITLYLPPETSGTVEAFNRLVLKPRGLKLAAGVTLVRSDADAADAVVRDAHGLALVSFSAVRGAKPLNLETQCGLITRPSGFGVKTEEYPLARRLYLATGAAPAQPSGRGLVRMATAAEAQRMLAASRLIDLSVSSIALADHSERMASAINAPAAAFDLSEMRQMLADLAGYSRLSINLRFNSAGELDARSRKEIGRLGAALKEPAFAGKRVLLAGFTDSAGKFQANLTVGLKRAGQVRTALLTAAGAGLDPRLIGTKGYGALAPVACNTTGDGQRLNRRVEVWVAEDTPARSAVR